jgi:succinate-semialdehyde dehydrogenase / glutarate-semialdehyde dehydrogenase
LLYGPGKPAHRFRKCPCGVNADRLANDVEAGNLSINHFVASVAETPFGGVKDSGYGREGGIEGLYCYTVAKNVSHKMI